MNISRIIFSVFLAGLFIFLLFRQVDFANVRELGRNLNWTYSVLAFLAYFGLNVLRAIRFELLLNRAVKLRAMLNIIFVQNFFNVILPFRLGELSYIHFIRSYNISFGKNMASLIGARFLDLLSIVIIFLFSLFSLIQTVSYSITLIIVSLVLILILFIVLPLFFWLFGIIEHRLTVKNSDGALGFILRKVIEVRTSLISLNHQRLLINAGVLSLAIWLMTFLVGMFLFRSVLINFGFWEAVFAYAFPVVASFTPFHFFAGFGSYESVTSLGLIILGLNNNVAISSSLMLHLQELVFVVILAMVGFWQMTRSRHEK